MRINGHARSKTGLTPFKESLLGDCAIDKFEGVFLGEAKPFVAEGEAVGDGKLFEVAVAGIADFGGVNLEVFRARGGERLFDGGLQIFFQRQPHGFGDNQRAQDENRLDGIPQVRAGLAGFIQINQVHC